MSKITKRAEELGHNLNNCTVDDANQIFLECEEVISLPKATDTSRKRRREQMSWLTVVKGLRNEAKKKRRKL